MSYLFSYHIRWWIHQFQVFNCTWTYLLLEAIAILLNQKQLKCSVAKDWCNIEMDRSLWSRHFSLLCHRKLRRQRLEIAWRSEAILGRLRRSPCTGQSRVWNSFFDKQTHTYTRERKMSVEFWYWKCSTINNKTRSKMQARINNTLFVNVTQF